MKAFHFYTSYKSALTEHLLNEMAFCTKYNVEFKQNALLKHCRLYDQQQALNIFKNDVLKELGLDKYPHIDALWSLITIKSRFEADPADKLGLRFIFRELSELSVSIKNKLPIAVQVELKEPAAI